MAVFESSSPALAAAATRASSLMEVMSTPSGAMHVAFLTINGVLIVTALAVLLRAYWEPRPEGDSQSPTRQTLGMHTGLQFFLFFGYIFFSTTHMFLQARAGATHYSPISATILVYFGKASVALGMHIYKNGPDFTPLVRPSGGRFGKMPAVVFTTIPGALFAAYDALSFFTLASLDPVTYQIVVHFRVFVIAFFWQMAFRQELSGTQWLSLALFVLASVAKSEDKLQQVETVARWGLILLFGQVAFSAFNSVYSEVLLKELPVPTDLMNATMYTQGLIALLAFLPALYGPDAVLEQLLLPAAWGRLWGDPWMLSSVVCLVVFGIFTAYFLRELSCVLKELTGACVMVIAAIFEWWVFQASPCTVVGLQSAIIAVLALLVYNTQPIKAPSATLAKPKTTESKV